MVNPYAVRTNSQFPILSNAPWKSNTIAMQPIISSRAQEETTQQTNTPDTPDKIPYLLGASELDLRSLSIPSNTKVLLNRTSLLWLIETREPVPAKVLLLKPACSLAVVLLEVVLTCNCFPVIRPGSWPPSFTNDKWLVPDGPFGISDCLLESRESIFNVHALPILLKILLATASGKGSIGNVREIHS